jgi:hypothetical protein
MVRKSPEEKAADRKANFEKRVAQTAARDAARRAQAQETLRREQAEHSANVAATARTLAEQGRPFAFSALGVSVLDGIVYVSNRGELRRLGPLAGAVANTTRLSPRKVHRSAGAQLVFGIAAVRNVEQAAIIVTAGSATHQRTVEERWAGDNTAKRAQRESRDFNELARQANPALADKAAATPIESRRASAAGLHVQLERVRAGIADVSKSRQRAELQITALAQQIAKIDQMAAAARRADRQDLAQQAVSRGTALRKASAELETAIHSLRTDEEKLIAMAHRLQGRISSTS